MDADPVPDLTAPEGLVVLVCEPVVLTGGFVLCRELGDTTVLHVHDHRQGPNHEPVAFIARRDTYWTAYSGDEVITGDGIVDVFEEWIAVGVAATRMAATPTRS